MINTTLVYVEQDGQYLMLHRVKKKNDINHDKWIGVGGKCEENESPEDCALRETFEETGLTLNTLSYRGVVTFVSDQYEGEYMHLFVSDDFSGTVHACNEGNLEWVRKDRVGTLPIWEGDKIFLDLIRRPCPFFSLKLEYNGNTLVCHTLHYFPAGD